MGFVTPLLKLIACGEKLKCDLPIMLAPLRGAQSPRTPGFKINDLLFGIRDEILVG
jgi:hypothetical protein